MLVVMTEPRPTGDVRAALLQAATRRFAAQGFSGTSVQELADDVGIKKPSLLYWFPSKDALREAVLDSLLDRWLDEVPVLLAAAASGPDRFGAVLSAVLDFFNADADRGRLLLRELLDRPEDLRRRLHDKLGPLMGLIVAAFRQAQADGRARGEVDAEAFLVNVLVLVVGLGATGDVADALLPSPAGARRRTAELLGTLSARYSPGPRS